MASYATPTMFRAYRDQVPSSKDAQIQVILDRANDLVDKVLGIEFAAWGSASDKKVRGNNNPRLLLPYHREGYITSVVRDADGQTISTDEWEEVGQHLYYCDAMGSELNWGAYRYTITGVWGYGPVPESVVEIELELAINIWATAPSGRFTNIIGVSGSGGVGYEGAMTPIQRKALALVRGKYGKDRLFG